MKYAFLLALVSVCLVSAYASPVDTQRVVVYETDLENNLVQLISAEDEKNENRSVLEQLKERLLKLVEKLKKDGKSSRAKIVQYYIKVLDQIVEQMDKNQIELKQVREFIKRVKKYLEKYSSETPEDLVFAIFEDEEPKDPEDIDDGDDEDKPEEPIPDDDKEEKKSRLEELREQLRQLRDRLVKRGKTVRARIVGHYLRLLDRILDRLEKNEISLPRVEDFIRRCKKFLEKFVGDEDEEDNKVAQLVSSDDEDENIPDDDEDKENRSILERLREKLVDLLERLRSRNKTIRAKIVEHYIRVLDRILDRMDRHDISLPRVRDFINRCRKFLEDKRND